LDRDTIQNGTLKAEKGSWNITTILDQYLYEPKKALIEASVSSDGLVFPTAIPTS